MRIGIVADIHEAVEPLHQALAEFRRRRVDQVVSLGDACDSFTCAGRSADVVALLRGAGAVGVWGNHDVGFCFDIPERVRRDASPEVLAYMSSMQPHLVIADCRFSHVEPWLDARRVEDLWFVDGPPEPIRPGPAFDGMPKNGAFVDVWTEPCQWTPGVYRRRNCRNRTEVSISGVARSMA